MNKKLLSLYGLKWSPFSSEVPTEALYLTPRVESFCWRIEQLASEGGFALVTGDSGVGKSVTLRILAERLAAQRDTKVGVFTRPQAGLADFFREMGDLFGVALRPHNRYAGSKVLRERWQTHIDTSLSRPVLVVDEAQEMSSSVLAELRLLSAVRLDSQVLLTIVLAGDRRLVERFRSASACAWRSSAQVLMSCRIVSDTPCTRPALPSS
jgi:type II secretory pathway predicted ATPase ExeA